MTVDRPDPTPPAPTPPSATPPSGRPSAAASAPVLGLAGLRAHLDRIVRRHRLRSIVVVVDDPDIGRQAFRAGSGAIEAGIVATGPGVTTDPPVPRDELDADMLVALCAMSLHLELLGEVEEPDVDGELALRRLPGVYAVALERDGDLTLCHVLAAADAPEDVARRAAEALTASTGAKVVVEVLRDAPGTAGRRPAEPERAVPPTSVLPTPVRARPAAVPRPTLSPSIQERFADATWSDDAATLRTPTARIDRPAAGPVAAPTTPRAPAAPAPAAELVAIRSVPEAGEIEVHLVVGGTRAIGRAPLARGLAGAAEAVLVGMRQLDPTLGDRAPVWVRTVETTADGRFVVAVSLSDPSGQERHGIATGTSPIDGAARATTLAMNDPPVSGSGESPSRRPDA